MEPPHYPAREAGMVRGQVPPIGGLLLGFGGTLYGALAWFEVVQVEHGGELVPPVTLCTSLVYRSGDLMLGGCFPLHSAGNSDEFVGVLLGDGHWTPPRAVRQPRVAHVRLGSYRRTE